MNDKEKILMRLKPYAQGCFSGRVSEWPQLKPLLKDLYEYISKEDEDGNSNLTK